MEQKESWNWNGKMIDCNGRVCLLHINAPNQEGRSDFLVEMTERDGHASQFKGLVNLSYDDQKNMKLQFLNSNEKGYSEKAGWVAVLKPFPAGSYAKESVFGTYESLESISFLTNGVLIMWQFD